jgi:ribonuclease HI
VTCWWLGGSLKNVEIYADGACIGNPGPGGWGVLLRYGKVEKELSGGEPETTNNRMELTAVIRGLQALKHRCRVTITTDSRYVMNGFDKNWISGWRQRGWKTSTGSSVKNQDLWEELDDLVNAHICSWIWVKGHNGHADNERVDSLAQAAAERVKKGGS